jgi:hypothetical protein
MFAIEKKTVIILIETFSELIEYRILYKVEMVW